MKKICKKFVSTFCIVFLLLIFTSAIAKINSIEMNDVIISKNLFFQEYRVIHKTSYESALIKKSIENYNGINEDWNMTFGGKNYDVGRSIIEISNGYIFVGRTQSYGSTGYNLWMVKIDNNGNEEWNRTYGGANDDWGSYIIQSEDGFIISGTTYSYGHGDADVWLLKTDFEGNELWNQTYGGKLVEFSWSIEQTNDGGYIIGALSNSFGNGLFDGWIIKTDDYGVEQWNRTYGGTNDEWILEIHQTIDNGFIIIGGTYSQGSGGADIYLIKTDSNGNEEWNRTYGNQYHNNGFAVKETKDGGYIISAESKININYDEEPNFYALVIKTDNKGFILWDRIFGQLNHDTRGTCIKETPDGGYIFSATDVNLQEGNCSVLLIKTDVSGNIIWLIRILNAIRDEFSESHISLTSDEGCIIISSTLVNSNVDVWIIKYSSFTNNRPIIPYTPTGPLNGKINTEYTFFSSSIDVDNDHIFYLFDWGDGSNSGWLGPFDSGEECHASHSWERIDEYNIRVKARDIHGGESEWSDPLTISIPKTSKYNSIVIPWIYDWFSYRFLFLNFLINYLELKK